jgi:hypothetical protein
MGRQIQLYFSPQDVDEFATKMVAKCGAVLLPHRLSSNLAQPVDSITRDTGSGLRSNGYLVRGEDLERVRLREIPSPGYWAVDEVRSPVIEFDGGFFDHSKILRGRLYFTTSYYDLADQHVVKEPGFVQWADRILAAGRRHGVRSKLLGATVAAHAQALHIQGCELRAP